MVRKRGGKRSGCLEVLLLSMVFDRCAEPHVRLLSFPLHTNFARPGRFLIALRSRVGKDVGGVARGELECREEDHRHHEDRSHQDADGHDGRPEQSMDPLPASVFRPSIRGHLRDAMGTVARIRAIVVERMREQRGVDGDEGRRVVPHGDAVGCLPRNRLPLSKSWLYLIVAAVKAV